MATRIRSSPERSHRAEPQDSSLRIRDLVRITGIPRSTIQFYVRERLLTGLDRQGATSIVYPAESIERLRLIKRLQKEERLTIPEIRRVLSLVDRGGDPQASLGLMQTMGPIHGQVAVCNTAQLARSTGLTGKQITAALEMGLLAPTTQGEFDPEDVMTGTLMRRFIELGGGLNDLEFYRRIGAGLVAIEIGLQQRLIRGRPIDEAISVTQEVTAMAKHMRAYILQRMLYEKTLLQIPGGAAAVKPTQRKK